MWYCKNIEMNDKTADETDTSTKIAEVYLSRSYDVLTYRTKVKLYYLHWHDTLIDEID